MTAPIKRATFFETEEGLRIKQVLFQMAKDSTYNTGSTYSANAEQYPDHLIPFVDKHVKYLTSHPAVDPNQYVANLRLMTRIRA